MTYRILSLGYDSVLLPIRSGLLKQAGYEVIESGSWKESLKFLHAGAFDLLMICHTVPAELREALIELIQPLRPHLKVLCLQSELYSYFKDCPSANSLAPQFLADVHNAVHKSGI